MNRNDAKEIAEVITNKQLQEMLSKAKTEIKDWTKVSTCNKGFTKGVAWNILGENFDINYPYHNISKINMIREFGEFLPDELKPKKNKRKYIKPVHHDPKFLTTD